jgi:hypothetical protein
VNPQSPVFVKAYDLLKWLLPATARFLRQQRFVLARQIEEAAFAFHRAIIEAGAEPGRALEEADRHLVALRMYLRLACDLRFCSVSQYEHAARLVDELGRLVGGWKRKLADPVEAPTAARGRGAGAGPRPARRGLEQQPGELADGEPERQHAGQPERQRRVPLRE